jgi:hypothetical protein
VLSALVYGLRLRGSVRGGVGRSSDEGLVSLCLAIVEIKES